MLRLPRIAIVLLGAVVLTGASCTARPRADSTAAATLESDSLRIARLEREARAIANVKGCSRASDCRSAPVGAKACGGPRDYIVFCAATTDTVKLFARLRELQRVETEYNAKSGMVSNCMFREPPTVVLVGGSCRESPRTP